MSFSITPFSQCSYLSQIRRLRSFAVELLKRYRVSAKAIDFINHGENTTFKITDVHGQKYLFRIHREGYHTKTAIKEELMWLRQLAKKNILVPQPVLSKDKNLIESAFMVDLDLNRHCCLFKWIEGQFILKSISAKHMVLIGQMLATLQNESPKRTSRKYWHADGLLGKNAKFGSIDDLPGLSLKDQKFITQLRIKTLKHLNKYQARFPERMGLIHADLHFGNLLFDKGQISAIDFDDCGFGFFVYDLAVNYVSIQNVLGHKKKKQHEILKKSLIEGYTSIKSFDKYDQDLFSHLVTARRLLMLGWLNSRSDNLVLKKYFKKAVKKVLNS
jgi:Ser/Thr protein kinase RdoA (MazF antagonist)